MELEGRSWSWEAAELPGDGEHASLPYLSWYRITFCLRSDPEQTARVRVGVPPDGWSGRNLRSVLRSARERTWRDVGGTLWDVRVEGWGRADPKEGGQGEPSLVFTRAGETGDVEDSEPVLQRSARGVASLTAAADEDLQTLLDSAVPA